MGRCIIGRVTWYRSTSPMHSPPMVCQVSAVSPKTNTTHHCRLGAYTEGPSQVVIYDTPGVVGKECAGGWGARWGAYYAGRHNFCSLYGC